MQRPTKRSPAAPRRAALPAGRAFVVQLYADADLANGVVRGRVEHVVSGVAARFDSVADLIGWMARAASSEMPR
ncbi:MAG TPA: hypothetical protein VKW76_05650 [Candidatus Binatia bacterium]|nr:hypothetical protein [Candidatus Binatia bacterium]